MFKIMIADDEQLIRAGLIKTIKKHFSEARFCEAQDGASALEQYKAFNPDFVITDVKMPVMDGINLVRVLREQKVEIPVIIVSGFNDFAYAKSAMRFGVQDYLLKPIDENELFDAINKVIEKKRQAVKLYQENSSYIEACCYFRSLINGENSNRPLPASFIYKRYFIAVSYIYDIAKYHPDTLNTADIIQMLQQSISKRMKCLAFEVNVGEIICIINMDDNDTRRAENSLTEVLSNIRRQFDYSVSFGYYTETVDGHGVEKAYKSASLAALYRIYDENTLMFPISDNFEKINYDSKEWNAIGGRIVRCVLDENQENCILLIDEMFLSAANIKLFPKVLIDLVISIVCKVNNYLLKIDPHFDMRFSTDENRINAIFRCERLQNINKDVRDIFIRMFQLIKTRNTKECKRIIDKAKQFILDREGINVTLKSCAEHVCLNAAYLSYLFKRETGDNFINFVTEIKMNKAAKLLAENPEMRIYEIAYQLGYDDVKYFNRVFKKIFLISPGEYRERSIVQ